MTSTLCYVANGPTFVKADVPYDSHGKVSCVDEEYSVEAASSASQGDLRWHEDAKDGGAPRDHARAHGSTAARMRKRSSQNKQTTHCTSRPCGRRRTAPERIRSAHPQFEIAVHRT